MTFNQQTIWIIGASSGIGAALADKLARSGATLILSARRAERLEQLRQSLPGDHHVVQMDISRIEDVHQATKTVLEITDKLDRVVVMAGTYAPSTIDKMTDDNLNMIMAVNFLGPVRVAQCVMPIFRQQGHGQLVLCASVAGYIGLPYAQPYSASKAALINFTESLYAEAPPTTDIKLICPGFVRTPMTDKNRFKMPMIIEPEQAAEAIVKGLNSQHFEIHFPKKFTLLLKVLQSLPYRIKLSLSRKYRPKGT
ncbi:SDR family NAD(P)-dependent oxidoreductase [Gynuella sunshinyii]|uniref:Short-chain dehydrogenase of various substrate specificities n=1 Tax=Gynuella sunshinyii YC6258 TaxID=1445510 RepID=A0A0C5VK16_9GAMM|nr:SDR family NAD(P)-dependent oxidoreductase [Gynuella sunshinyii]AJQ95022.1 short-chain dehydrogenase of various substrate specificities [Gynuella sunshinyii YC6258]